MGRLRQLVRSLARPKVISGRPATGPELAALIRRVAEALNAREIPSAGAVLEHFNEDVMKRRVGPPTLFRPRDGPSVQPDLAPSRRCVDAYSQQLAAVGLPAAAGDLQRLSEEAGQRAVERFRRERFRSPQASINQEGERRLQAGARTRRRGLAADAPWVAWPPWARHAAPPRLSPRACILARAGTFPLS